MQDFVACKVPFFGGTEPKLFLLKRETRKIVLVMKITAVLLLAAVLQVSAKSWGQEKITLSFNNAPLEQVLNSIHSQANVEFIYRTDYVKDKKVTVNVSNASLKTVLDLCLQNQQLTYDIFGKNVSIHPEKREGKEGKPSENPIYGTSGPVDVTGRVTDPQGEPIVGANVVIKRNGSGTITNANGQFTLKNVNSDDIIVISFVGYSPLSVKVGDKTNFLLVMNIAVNKLDAAVVQAYGKTTDRLRTGNITTVTSQEIEQHPVMNVLQALQGKVPGLEVTPSSGYASAPYKVEIRGRKYLNNSLAPDPLIIVDGVPITVLNFQDASFNGTKGFSQSGVQNPIAGYSPLFSIDPNEIESITVLKDADATAIYGSRGGSGVILITTKRGKAGTTKFNASYSTGFEKNLKWYNLMNTQQYLSMRREAISNEGYSSLLSDPTYNPYWPDLTVWDTTRYTNWQKYLFGGTGRVTNVESSLSGGSNSTVYRISLDYQTKKNITTASGSNDRISFNSNISHSTLNNMFKFDLTNLYTYTKVNTVELPTNAVLLPPNAPSVFDSSGKLNYGQWAPATDLLNSFGSLVKSYEEDVKFLNSRLGLTFTPFHGLSFKSSFGYSSWGEESKFVIPIASQNPRFNPKGSLSDGTTNGTTWIIEPQIDYNYLNKYFKTEILIGSTFQSVLQKSLGVEGTGYTDDNLLGSVANAPIKYGTDARGQYKYFAVFSRVNFNVLDKYIINLTGRRDGSSRFGPGKQFGSFGSIGAAWILSQEKWFKSVSNVISFAKFRGSFGTTGSDNIADYVYLTRWSPDRSIINPYGGGQSYAPIQHANPDLQWQENRKLEIAGNFNFLNDRLGFEVAWYRDRCGNQLLAIPLPIMTGFSLVNANLPATVQNSGWEVRFNATIIKNKKVNLSYNFNIGANKNKLEAFPNLENTSYANQYVVGKSLNTRYIYHFTGVDPATGLYTFEDKDKDGKIDPQISIKNKDAYGIDLTPKYFGGMGLDLNIGRLSLNTFFTYARLPFVPRAVFNASFVPGTFGTSNQSVKVLNRWTKPGDNAEFSKYKITPVQTDQLYVNSDAIYSNGSYIRFQNISLSYSVSEELIKKAKIKTANIFIRAENIATFSKYDGLDPTSAGLGTYPMPFTVVAGGMLSF